MKDWVVVDSSVAVKWYIPEPGSDRAALLLAGQRLIAPDLLIPEIGNVLWKRRRDIPAAEIEAITDAIVSHCPVSLYPSDALLQGAVALALTYERTVYDSLYLALAVGQDCQFVTSDERLSNALQDTDLAEYVHLL